MTYKQMFYVKHLLILYPPSLFHVKHFRFM